MNDPRSLAEPPRRARWQRVLHRLFGVLLGSVVLLLIGQASLLLAFVRPTTGHVQAGDALRAAALAAGGIESVEFRSGDGLLLRGEILGDLRRPVVLFGHGYRGRRRQGDGLAGELLRAGCAVLLFDFRGNGESDGSLTYVGAREAEDVHAAIRYLTLARNVPAQRMAYVGVSMGAAAGLLAADHLAPLRAVALIAPYADLFAAFEARTLAYLGLPIRPWFEPARRMTTRLFGIDPARVRPIDHAALLAETPTLLIGGEADLRVPPGDLHRIADRLGPRGTIHILPGLEHDAVCRLRGEPTAQILAFLRIHLLAERP